MDGPRRLVEQGEWESEAGGMEGEFPEEYLFTASCYLARHVMDSLGDSFQVSPGIVYRRLVALRRPIDSTTMSSSLRREN